MEAKFRVTPETGGILYLHRWGKWLPALAKMWNGYTRVSFHSGSIKKTIRAHHLVWVWVHGKWPIGEIDHINGDRADNRIANLREVTVAQNRTNKKIQTNNRSGFKWVYWCQQRSLWTAEIHAPRSMGIGRKRLHQTFHKTAEEAYAAACEAARKLHGPFFNPG